MGNVRLYGSTSGYTELAPPAVAPDGVLSLPSGTGTLLTAEGGKVLQVVRATDTTLRSTTSTSFVDVTGMSVTITPTATTSVVLIIVTTACGLATGGGYMQAQITDSSNNAISGAEFAQFGDNSAGFQNTDIDLIGYATPATTSATTYKLRFRREGASPMYVYNDMQTGQIFAIEVSA